MTPSRKTGFLRLAGLALSGVAIAGIWKINWIEQQMVRIWGVVGLLALVIVCITLFLHREQKLDGDGR